jgi:hypothetical protein
MITPFDFTAALTHISHGQFITMSSVFTTPLAYVSQVVRDITRF